MQTLQVKKAGGGSKTVRVLRSFQDISGAHIFIHADGTYGYKDGTPVRSVAELNNLPPEHRKLALSWWERTGEKASRAYYKDIADKDAIRAGDFQENLANEAANTMLDAILYSRRTGKKGAVTAPKPWIEYGFNQRPDWWGQAKCIDFADYSYIMLDPDSTVTPVSDTQTEPGAKTEGQTE